MTGFLPFIKIGLLLQSTVCCIEENVDLLPSSKSLVVTRFINSILQFVQVFFPVFV
jgi:hypothetical protein